MSFGSFGSDFTYLAASAAHRLAVCHDTTGFRVKSAAHRAAHVHSLTPFASDKTRPFFSSQSSAMRSREGLYLSKSWRTKSAVD